MRIQDTIKGVMKKTNTNQIDIARKLGVSQANISKKLNCKSIKFDDFVELVETCGATVEINIVLPDGTKF